MDEELDKRFNRKSGFNHPSIDPERHVRLLRLSCLEPYQACNYSLETFPLEDLPSTHYKALSYTWGAARILDDIREIEIDGQSISIRLNLYHFLKTAAAKGEYGRFFIDAVCINQLDHEERQFQVPEMARIYRNAKEVIAWLGLPDTSQFENVRALSQIKDKNCAIWTTAQLDGYKYLSHHRYWSRIWIVQEVLLASRIVIWCGFFTFPPELFKSVSHSLPFHGARFDGRGRPARIHGYQSRFSSPAEITISHRLRQVLLPAKDTLAQGTNVGTLEEMKKNLRKASTVVETYQSLVPDPIYQIVRKFSRLDCSDPRDKLYGFLDLIHERTGVKIMPDYTKDVDYAFYQALKIGLDELHFEVGVKYGDGEYLGYYCDVRDAFGISEGPSRSILQKVIRKLNLRAQIQGATLEFLWQQQLVSRDSQLADFKQLLEYADQDAQEYPASGNLMFKFHQWQRGRVERL